MADSQIRNYKGLVDNLRTVVDDQKPIMVLHIPFNTTNIPTPALEANARADGVTEVVLRYFPSDLSPDYKDAIMFSIDKMRPVMERSTALGVYDGWTLENNVKIPGPDAFEGQESQVYINILGWANIDSHKQFLESEDFQQNKHHMFDIHNVQYVELYHVKLLEI